MSLHRFFIEHQRLADFSECAHFALELSAHDLRHARALRLDVGELIAVVDAAQNYYVCEVVSAPPATPDLRVRIARRGDLPAPTFTITLVAGVGKLGKLDDVIRAGTEIGVSRFVPFLSSRTVVRLDAKKAAARTQRWQTIAKSAAMQSGASTIPHIEAPRDLCDVASDLSDFDAVVVFWEEASADATLHAALAGINTHAPNVACVVGPEGGLSLSEVNMLLAANSNAHVACLGATILRTETAGIVAPALCAYELGGLGGACTPREMEN